MEGDLGREKPTFDFSRFISKDGSPVIYEAPFNPKHIFFYGTLTLPRVLQGVLGLESEPHLEPAVIYGYNQKMWGPYPALVKDPGPERDTCIQGKIWLATEKKHFDRLKDYEGSNYRVRAIVAKMTESNRPMMAFTFIWDGPQDILVDGTFDPSLFSIVHDV